MSSIELIEKKSRLKAKLRSERLAKKEILQEKKEISEMNNQKGKSDGAFYHSYFNKKKIKVNYSTDYKIDFLQVLEYIQNCNVQDNLLKLLYALLENLVATEKIRIAYYYIKQFRKK